MNTPTNDTFSNYGEAMTTAEQRANAEGDIYCVTSNRNRVQFYVVRYDDVKGRQMGVEWFSFPAGGLVEVDDAS